MFPPTLLSLAVTAYADAFITPAIQHIPRIPYSVSDLPLFYAEAKAYQRMLSTHLWYVNRALARTSMDPEARNSLELVSSVLAAIQGLTDLYANKEEHERQVVPPRDELQQYFSDCVHYTLCLFDT